MGVIVPSRLAVGAAAQLPLQIASPSGTLAAQHAGSAPGVGILLVDTDRVAAPINHRIYGHFLEHINHSVEDGLSAEQIQGWGFEGEDLKPFGNRSATEAGPSSRKRHFRAAPGAFGCRRTAATPAFDRAEYS